MCGVVRLRGMWGDVGGIRGHVRGNLVYICTGRRGRGICDVAMCERESEMISSERARFKKVVASPSPIPNHTRKRRDACVGGPFSRPVFGFGQATRHQKPYVEGKAVLVGVGPRSAPGARRQRDRKRRDSVHEVVIRRLLGPLRLGGWPPTYGGWGTGPAAWGMCTCGIGAGPREG